MARPGERTTDPGPAARNAWRSRPVEPVSAEEDHFISKGECIMAGRLEGKVGITTGAGSGIGRATALAFAREGAKVVVSDINEASAEETRDQILANGGDAISLRVDAASPEDNEALVRAAVDKYGRVDIAFNNAGIEGLIASTEEYPLPDWEKIIAINLSSVYYAMRAQIPQMREQGGGAIVNTASILGLVGFAQTPGYTAAKHGVVGLTKTAALENAPLGIRINAINPGFIETPLVMERGVKAGESKEAYDALVALHPMGRLGRSEEIANAVVWLASDEASFVTGISLPVDGGYTAR